MKKIIIAASFILSTGMLSSQTKVSNSAKPVMIVLQTSADKKVLASAD